MIDMPKFNLLLGAAHAVLLSQWERENPERGRLNKQMIALGRVLRGALSVPNS